MTLIGGLFHNSQNYNAPVDSQTYAGIYSPTGGQTYRLQATVGSTQTSINLTSFKEPVSNIPYTMSYLNSSIEYGTLSPQTSVSEFISFTGITQNVDGSAVLTGVTRGLSRSYPYTASTTLAQPHSGQSIFILSDTPQVFNQYANVNNAQAVPGLWTFTDPPIFTNVATSTSQAASIAYVNGVAVAGAPNSTESVKGIVELATQLESASSTSTGSTGASVVLQAKYATSSPSVVCGLCIPVTKNDGNLDPMFFDGTGAGNQYTFNATTTMSAAVISTSTITSLNVTNATTSNLYVANLTGNIIAPKYTTQPSITGASSGTYATTTLISIPLNTLKASSTIQVSGTASCNQGTTSNNGACILYLTDSTGAPFGSISITARADNSNGVDTAGSFFFTVMNQSSVSSQKTGNVCSMVGSENTGSNQVFYSCGSGGTTSSINTGNALTLDLVLRAPNNISVSASGVSVIINP